MNKANFYMKYVVSIQASNWINVLALVLLTSLLSACQLTQPMTDNATQYSQYYLCLKSLEKKEVLAEEKRQKALLEATDSADPHSKGKLILIYSLPSTPLHNPYKAKRLLNEHLLTNTAMSKDNLAFTLLLKDQLNIQLNMLNRQAKTVKELNAQQDKSTEDIEKLTQELERVNNQLILLKQIDQNINDRG